MQTMDEYAAEMQELLSVFRRLNPAQQEVAVELLRKLKETPGEDHEALFKSYKERLRRLT